jgi:hypothetical protein
MANNRESKDNRQTPTTPRKTGSKSCGCTQKGSSSPYEEEEFSNLWCSQQDQPISEKTSSLSASNPSYLNQGPDEDDDDDDEDDDDEDEDDEDEDDEDEDDDDDEDDEDEEEDRAETLSRKGPSTQSNNQRSLPTKGRPQATSKKK